MIYLFLGKDINILKSKINELITSLDIPNIIKYDYSEIELIDILNEVNYVDLFNDKKLVVVSNFSLKKLDEKEELLLIKYISNMSENPIILNCIDESLDERKKITKLLKEKCKVNIIEKLDYRGLHSYIEDLFNSKGYSINYDMVSKILSICDNNPDITINECNKLILYKNNKKDITYEDIEKVISKNNEREIFTFQNYVLSKDIAHALESYKILKSANNDEFALMESLSKQFRILLSLKDNNDYKSVARNFGVNEYSVQKLLPFTSKYTINDIADILYKISLLDEKVKIDGYEKEDVFENFLITL